MGTDVAGVAKGNEGADDAEVADENEEHEQQRGRAFLYVMFGLQPGQTLHMYTPKLYLPRPRAHGYAHGQGNDIIDSTY